jgi:hypothetical protein
MLHQELLEHFYHSFKYKDVKEMIACYHDDIVFTDPAFGTLKGVEAKNMWRMLLGQNSTLEIDYSNISLLSITLRLHLNLRTEKLFVKLIHLISTYGLNKH